MTSRTYAALLDEARSWLQRSKPVILDATHLMRSQRKAALSLAAETDARFLAIECDADERVVWERLSERRDDGRVVSDGRWGVSDAAERREPVDELPFGSHVTVDTARPLPEQIAEVEKHLAAVMSS